METETVMRPSTSHVRCFACGTENESGLRLAFTRSGENVVTGECTVHERYQGYPGVVQGGIVATILDCAMTNCLFSMGIQAMTARMNVQFKTPVATGSRLTAEGVFVRRRGKVYDLEARITQDGALCAAATAKFVETGNAL